MLPNSRNVGQGPRTPTKHRHEGSKCWQGFGDLLESTHYSTYEVVKAPKNTHYCKPLLVYGGPTDLRTLNLPLNKAEEYDEPLSQPEYRHDTRTGEPR